MDSTSFSLVLLVVIFALLIVLIFALFIIHDTRAMITELRDEVRYDIPPARRAKIEGSILAILRGTVETGVAFFVSSTAALTVAHNVLSASGSRNGHLKKKYCAFALVTARASPLTSLHSMLTSTLPCCGFA